MLHSFHSRSVLFSFSSVRAIPGTSTALNIVLKLGLGPHLPFEQDDGIHVVRKVPARVHGRWEEETSDARR